MLRLARRGRARGKHGKNRLVAAARFQGGGRRAWAGRLAAAGGLRAADRRPGAAGQRRAATADANHRRARPNPVRHRACASPADAGAGRSQPARTALPHPCRTGADHSGRRAEFPRAGAGDGRADAAAFIAPAISPAVRRASRLGCAAALFAAPGGFAADSPRPPAANRNATRSCGTAIRPACAGSIPSTRNPTGPAGASHDAVAAIALGRVTFGRGIAAPHLGCEPVLGRGATRPAN